MTCEPWQRAARDVAGTTVMVGSLLSVRWNADFSDLRAIQAGCCLRLFGIHQNSLNKGLRDYRQPRCPSGHRCEQQLHSGPRPKPLGETAEVPIQSRIRHVNLSLVGGIGPVNEPIDDSGWYVYCTVGLVLRADRTATTGCLMDDPDDEGSGLPVCAILNLLASSERCFFESDSPERDPLDDDQARDR